MVNSEAITNRYEAISREIDEITISIQSLQAEDATKERVTISQLDVLMQKKAALLEKKCKLIKEYSTRLEEDCMDLEKKEEKLKFLRKILEKIKGK